MAKEKELSEEIYHKIDYAKSIASTEPERSIKLSQEAYGLAKTNKLKLEEAYALLSIALASRVKTDINSMLNHSYQALQIFKEKNNINGQGKALNLIGISYFYGSIYEEALKSFLKADDLADLSNSDSLRVGILNNIGEVYKELKIYEKAMKYYTKAIENMGSDEFSPKHAVILVNIGEIYYAENKYSKALKVYNESHTILLKSSDMISLGNVENKIGKTYFILGDLEKAEEFYLKSLERLESINNKYYSIDTLLNLGNLYMEKPSENSFVFYAKAVEYSKSLGSKDKLCKLYGLISTYYESQEDYKNALEYYKRHSSLNEEIISLGLKNKLEILNIDIKNLEVDEKTNKIRTRLENEIIRQKNQLEKIKQTNEILQKKAYEDELTGISNRRSINIHIKKILGDLYSETETIALFMIDIDNFKKYNDYWGHAEGDECIKKITKSIKEIQSSRGDVFGRYGGEEFVYISSSINYEKALKLGNLIRRKVEEIGLFYIHKGKKKKTTISVGGILGLRSDFKSMAEIIELADRELYRSKDMGRNTTIVKDINGIRNKYNINENV